MRRYLLTLVLVLCVPFGLALRAAEARPFPQESSDLKPDPALHFGKLPNGFRYVIRANPEPKQRASLRLLVEAGAFHEKDDQQGLAHFLEHMAFNGSEHYKPGTLVEYFQRMGMSFGGDTNASTWFNRTLYLLELPDTKEATLAEGLRVFSDYSSSLLLDDKEIDRERGVILSEKRTRDSVGYRIGLATRNFLLNGTQLQKRDVIGPASVLEAAHRDRFVDFYNAWYRPELMTVVVVGDIDAAAVEKQIVAAFSGVTDRAPRRPDPDMGKVPTYSGMRTFNYYESEAPGTSVSIETITPFAGENDTAANRLKYLPRSLANAIINRRLGILAKQEGAPFIGGSISAGEGYRFYRETSIDLTCKADQWQPALGVADRELRRALQYGFQPAELKEIVARQINALEQAVKTEPTRHSDGIADEIAESILDREVDTDAKTDLELIKPALEKITVDDCVKALREAWSPDQRIVLVTGNAKLDGDANATIAAAYEKCRAEAVSAPETIADLKWSYTDFGPAGKVAKTEHVGDPIDATLITFENGVRLNLKKTDFEANRIRISVRLGTGKLTEPRDEPGLALYASQAFTAGGLGKYSADDLRRLLAGKTVGASFGVGEDACGSGGTTNREDLLLEMQLIAAHLTDPGYRPEAARQLQKGLEQLYLSFEHTANGPLSLEVARLVASGDSRFGIPAKDEMMKRNLAEVKTWLAPQLQHGAIEIAIVGDFDEAATIDAVAKTLGALPKRDPRPALDDLRHVSFPAQPFAKEYTIPTEIPKGNVIVYWPTADGSDIHRTRRLQMLGEVLTDRLRIKVRQELGDAYSPGAGNNSSEVYPGYGYMLANITVEPTRSQKIVDVIVELADKLAKEGVTDDELKRAKEPILTALRESSRTNAYWLGNVLARAQEKPEVLDWCRTRYADNEAITAEELSALAKQYLVAARASHVIVRPEPGAVKPATGAPTAPVSQGQ